MGNVWLAFTVGMIIGGCVGLTVACLCVAAGDADRKLDEATKRRLQREEGENEERVRRIMEHYGDNV